MKGFISKLSNLVVFFLIFLIMALPLHEAGHSLAAQVFGASGYIELDWFSGSGIFQATGELNTWQFAIVGFSGGGFVAILYGLILWFANVGIRWGEDDQTPIRLVLGGQLGYGIAEATLGFIDQSAFPALAGILTGIGFLAALLYSCPRLAKWLHDSSVGSTS